MFRNRLLAIISDASAGGGLILGLSLTDIYTLLGIVLSVGSIIVLIVNFILRIYDRVKDGKFTNEEKAETAKEILELKDEIEKLQKELDENGKN